jgi:hypothetical protein
LCDFLHLPVSDMPSPTHTSIAVETNPAPLCSPSPDPRVPSTINYIDKMVETDPLPSPLPSLSIVGTPSAPLLPCVDITAETTTTPSEDQVMAPPVVTPIVQVTEATPQNSQDTAVGPTQVHPPPGEREGPLPVISQISLPSVPAPLPTITSPAREPTPPRDASPPLASSHSTSAAPALSAHLGVEVEALDSTATPVPPADNRLTLPRSPPHTRSRTRSRSATPLVGSKRKAGTDGPEEVSHDAKKPRL